MTAYLQRGDKIHLALPHGANMTLDQLEKFVDETKRTYREPGVEIVMVTTASGLVSPEVVAVFRRKQG